MKNFIFLCGIAVLFLGCEFKSQHKHFITYYENGHIKAIIFYYQVKEKGEEQPVDKTLEIRYFINGKVKDICFFREQKLHGPSVLYDSAGHLICLKNYSIGKMDGVSFEVFKNGGIKVSTSYKNGKLTELFSYDSITKKCHAYSLMKDTNYLAFYLYNKTGLIKKKLYYQNKEGQRFYECYKYYQNNKIKSFIKKSEENKYYSTYHYYNNYDSITGKITETYRMLDKSVTFSKMRDTIIIRPYIDYRFDNLSNYKIEIINTTDKDSVYSVKGKDNIFKLKKEKKMSWLYKICDHLGCSSIPMTYDENAKW